MNQTMYEIDTKIFNKIIASLLAKSLM